jgi:hypothetical protein
MDNLEQWMVFKSLEYPYRAEEGGNVDLGYMGCLVEYCH